MNNVRSSVVGHRNAPPLAGRFAIAIAAGFIAWLMIEMRYRAAGAYLFGRDFSIQWRAADAMIRGYSPYVTINAFTTAYPFNSGYLYMLPAAVLLMPLGHLSLQSAMPLFSGISVAVLAFALMRDGYWRLPLLASAPLVWGVLGGQVVPLVTAALLLPSLGWLAPMKYTLGVAGALYTLSRQYVATALAIIIVTVVIWPWWPGQWWAERNDVSGHYYHVPIFLTGGFLLLAAVARWRRPEGRLLLALACMPQTMFFYDQLPLVLLAKSYRQALGLALASYVAPMVAIALHGAAPLVDRTVLFNWNAPIILVCYYLPCVAIVLSRPNQGEIPVWLERIVGRAPAWLRGRHAEMG